MRPRRPPRGQRAPTRCARGPGGGQLLATRTWVRQKPAPPPARTGTSTELDPDSAGARVFFGVGATSARAPPPRSLGPASALAILAMRTVAAASVERRSVIPPARAPFGPADAPTISRGVTSAETRRMGRGRTRVPDAGDGALQTRERRVQIDFWGTAVGGGQLLALLLVVRGRRRGALVRRRRDAALQFRREGAP